MRMLVMGAVLAVALAGCGGDPAAAPAEVPDPAASSSAAAPSPTPAATPAPTEADPYDVYLANNPDPSLVLSREDAQARAYLGCAMGLEAAPQTVDRVLMDAYVELCASAKAMASPTG